VEPEGMGISPDGKLLVNTSETTNMAHFIDTDSREIIGNVLVDSRPRVAEFTPDNKHVWVSAEIGGTVSVIDSAEKKVIHKIRFEIPGVSADAIQPVGVKITKDGKRAFVALGPANRVAEIDPATYEVKKYYLVGQRVWNMALGQNETRLYTTNGVSSDVSVIDLASEKVVKSLKVGRAPWGVVVKP
jgi:PQQ-dependent catabolism-associated beta-propeller protein